MMNDGLIPFINTVEFVGLGLMSLFLIIIVGMFVLERLIGPRQCDDCKKEMDKLGRRNR